MSLTKVTYSMIDGAAANVLDYGADPTGSNDSTTAIQAAITNNSAVYVPAGTYRISSALQIRKNNFSLFGAGSGASILKLVNGGSAVNIINVGKIDTVGAGDEPWENINVSGLCLDGNRSSNVPGPYDINGWGILTANISKSSFTDLKIINCWVAGAGNEINSNHNTWSDIYIENCGHNDGSYPASQGYPSFDINSSKYCSYSNIVTKGGYAGFRVLDNCWNNNIQATIYNATYVGFLMGNQPVNTGVFNNVVNVSVYNGCSNQGVVVGVKCWANVINAAVYGITGVGVYEIGYGAGSASNPGNNLYNVTTSQCGQQSCKVDGQGSTWFINSRQDGQGGNTGDYYAVDISGSYNQITASVYDDASPKVRGMALRSGATYNNIIDFQHTTLVTNFENFDISNTNQYYFQYFQGVSNVRRTATLNAGWSNSTVVDTTYVKDGNGFVHVYGTVTGGTGTIFTLPSGYHPPVTQTFPTIANGAIGLLQIDTSGNITLSSGTATNVSLGPICFFIG